MKAKKVLITGSVVIAALLLLAVGMSQAQGQSPEARAERAAEPEGMSAVDNYIPIQGQLTDDAGNPLNGNHSVTFSLYGVSEGSAPLCSDAHAVGVSGGLFSTYMSVAGCDSIDGRQLYLGVQVGSDAEMTPRQAIYPVLYAHSLRPGALISDTRTDEVLEVRNGGSGTGLRARSDTGYALWAQNWSSENAAVYGFNYGGDGIVGVSGNTAGVKGGGVIGVEGTGTDADFKASGTGVIQSVANSYLWVSGNGARPYQQSDSTIIDMDSRGGALVYRGADAESKNIMFPIAIMAPLYGQDVTVSGLDIYWQGETEFDVVSGVVLRRQVGVCVGSECYETLVYDTVDYTCDDDVQPQGCTVHFDISNNNVLTQNSGVLYLTLRLAFNSSDSWINIGGVRLTLEHD